MDAFLAIASKRDAREYAERTIPPELVARILDAGRLSGSARNRQPWRFLVIDDPAARERLAETVYVPENVRTAAFVVAVLAQGRGSGGFDCGRAAQNMMLAAWSGGVVSCPNGLADPDEARKLVGLGEDGELLIVLSFGYPASPRDPESRSPEEWSLRARRKPLEEIVRTL